MAKPMFLAWTPWLRWFPEALQADMLGLLQQLSGLLTQSLQAPKRLADEHSGFGQVRQRGRYENLLASEWLLAEAAPDEFLRRVVHHEHLFLAPQPEPIQPIETVVVIFDCGLEQLGAPRLVQLALLLLLANRAEAQGQTLYWGILPGPPRLYGCTEAEDIQRFLKQRQRHVAEPAQLDDWATWLTATQMAPDELWLVGAEALVLPLPAMATYGVVLARALLLEQALDVQLHRRSGQQWQGLVRLPAVSMGQRLLKGWSMGGQTPMALAQVKARFDLGFSPILSENGQHVLVKIQSPKDDRRQHYLIINFAQSTPTKKGQPRKWTVLAAPIGIDCTGSRGWLMALVGDPLVGQLHRSDEARTEGSYRLFFTGFTPDDASTLQPMLVLQRQGQNETYLISAGDKLLAWMMASKGGTGVKTSIGERRIVANDVVALHRLNQNTLLYARHQNNELSIHYDGRSLASYPLGACPRPVGLLFWGRAQAWAESLCACAVAETAQRWRLYIGASGRAAMGDALSADQDLTPEAVVLPSGWRAVGLMPHQSAGMAFIVYAQQEGQVAFYHQGQLEVMVDIGAEIAQIAYCPHRKQLACLSMTQQLLVYRLPTGTLQYALNGQGGGHE